MVDEATSNNHLMLSGKGYISTEVNNMNYVLFIFAVNNMNYVLLLSIIVINMSCMPLFALLN